MDKGGEYKEKGSWDRGISYKKLEKAIRQAIDERKKIVMDKEDAKTKLRTLTKACALYTQLLNGSRISEACEALRKFHESGEREVKVMLGKQTDEQIKKQRYVRTRLIHIPDIVITTWIVPNVLETSKIASWCINVFGFNTHTLRYAFVTKMSDEGMSPQNIAKITGHRNLEYIIDYTQEIEANEKLYENVYGKKRK